MLHIRTAALTTIGLGALHWLPRAAAQAPTAVEVRFELTDPKFRTPFGAAAADLEKRIATLIAERLGTRVGFVRFVVGQSAEYRLTFSLDRSERTSTGRFDERGLWARLTLPDSSRSEIYWLPVRTADRAHLAVGTATELQSELRLLLTHANLESLKTELLAQVPIATRALAWASPLGWALPFSHRDLCMKNQTRLKIVNELPSGDVRLELPYQASVSGKFQPSSTNQELQPFQQRIFTIPAQTDRLDELRRALNGGQVKVLGVYVTQYQHDESVCRSEPLRPTTGGPGGGAQ